MPCLVGCLWLSLPRLVLLLTWLFTDAIGEAYETKIWPFLGFFFLPVTTLAYAFVHTRGQDLDGAGWIVMIVAVLVDLGVLGFGRRRRRNPPPAGGGQGGGSGGGQGGFGRVIDVEARRIG
ncbi:MAG: hypothetical protein RL112_1755 [Planctomycetota bacterium]|jgi:hypothetical protein